MDNLIAKTLQEIDTRIKEIDRKLKEVRKV